MSIVNDISFFLLVATVSFLTGLFVIFGQMPAEFDPVSGLVTAGLVWRVDRVLHG